MLRNTKPLTEDDVRLWRESVEANGIREAVIHTNYLINLGSPDRRIHRVAREAFVEEMERAQQLGVRYVVFHPGAHMGRGEAHGLRRVAAALDWCLERADAPDVVPCIENMAGQGTTVGHRFEHLKAIIERSAHGERLGVCIDSCHLFAAGYDIRTRQGYETVFALLDDVVGLDRVRAFHLNDSKEGVKSRVDRHEHIGRGKLKKEAFAYLVNDVRFTDIPAVLETPGDDPAFKRNLKLIRSLIQE